MSRCRRRYARAVTAARDDRRQPDGAGSSPPSNYRVRAGPCRRQPLDESFAPLKPRSGLPLESCAGARAIAAASLVLARRMIEPIEAIRARLGRIAGALDQRSLSRAERALIPADEFTNCVQLGESYATLEQKVADRTHDRQSSIASRRRRSTEDESPPTFDLSAGPCDVVGPRLAI